MEARNYIREMRMLGIILVLSATVALSTNVSANDKLNVLPAEETTEWCKICHSRPELKGTLLDGEQVSVYVDFDKYWQSVHGTENINCHNCHEGKEQYLTTAAAKKVVCFVMLREGK